MDYSLDALENNYKQESDIRKKLDILNNIIVLYKETDSDVYELEVYRKIKIWFEIYLSVIQDKTYAYDEISYAEVIRKVEFVKPIKRVQLLDYFIRLLKKDFFTENIHKYEIYKKKQEIIVLREEGKYLKWLLKKTTFSFLSIVVTLSISFILFSTMLYFFDSLSFQMTLYAENKFANCLLNLLAYVFNIGELSTSTIGELIFLSLMKLYFYTLITYFVIKEFTIKVNSI